MSNKITGETEGNSVDPRRLIKFGNASYVISLPSVWVRENKLEKGDIIYLEKNSNNELVIQPTNNKGKEKKELIINAKKDARGICREIISGYTNCYDIIILEGENLMPKFNKVREIATLVGAEILQIKKKKIIIKVSLDEEKVSFAEMMRRADQIIKEMIEMLQNQISKKNNKLSKEIFELDKDLNKIYFLIWRMVNYYLINKKIPKEKNVDFFTLSNFKGIITNLEYIGDEIKRISRIFAESRIKKEQAKDLNNILSKIKYTYGGVMKAFHTKDKESVFSYIKNRDNIVNGCDSIFKKNKEVSIGQITEKIKTICRHTHHNAKIVMY